MLRLAVTFLAAWAAEAAFPGNAVINNKEWKDVDGNFIHAHGGQIVEYNNVFYWIGTSKKLPGGLSEGMNCYSSTDMVNWKFVNEIFHNSSIVHGGRGNSPWRIARPKVLHSSKTGKWVMWFHLDSNNFSLQSVGVATASSICGNYQWVSGFRPDGLPSFDMGAYQEGSDAYLVRSVKNQYAGISKMTPDFLNTTGIISAGPRIEGQCIFKLNSYYLLGSHLTGWNPNPAELCTTGSSTLTGAKWDNTSSGCPNPSSSSTTYNSQSTFVVRFEDTVNKKYVFMYMGDIWNAPNVNDASYLWLPLVFKENNPQAFPSMPNYANWTLGDFAISM